MSRTMAEVRREMLLEAKENELVKVYGLSELTAAAIIAAGHVKDFEFDCEQIAADLGSVDDCSIAEMELYTEFAKANGAGYML